MPSCGLAACSPRAIALVAGDIDAPLDEANDAGFDSSDTQLILDRY
ncbi:hypothetical protein ACUJ8H_14290 [Streptomyces sp. EKR5.2]